MSPPLEREGDPPQRPAPEPPEPDPPAHRSADPPRQPASRVGAPLAAVTPAAPTQSTAEHHPVGEDLWSRLQWSRFGPLVLRALLVVAAGAAAFAFGLLIGGLIS